MHSYEGPSGRTYHHTAEGSVDDDVEFTDIVFAREATIVIEMRDVLWLAAEHVRRALIERIEEMSDEDILSSQWGIKLHDEGEER